MNSFLCRATKFLRKRQFWLLWLKILVTVLCILYVVRSNNEFRLQGIFLARDYFPTALSFCLLILGHIFNGLRYRGVCEYYGGSMKSWLAIVVTGVSFFLNQFLPGSIGGELVRYFHLRKSFDVSLSVKILLFDRLLGLAVILLFLFVFVGFTLFVNEGAYALLGFTFASWAVFVLVGVWVLTLVFYRFQVFSRQFFDICVYFFQSWLYFLSCLAGYICFALAFSILICNCASMNDLSLAFLMSPIIFIAVQVPIALGGWGVREVVALGVLSGSFYSSESVLAGSFVFGLLLLASSAPFIFVFLMYRLNLLSR